MSERKDLTEAEAFRAMAAFLELCWERGRSEEIATLLGSLATQPDGKPADPGLAQDWADCVLKAVARREGKVKNAAQQVGRGPSLHGTPPRDSCSPARPDPP